MKRRKLYEGEDYVFWREAEALQGKMASLGRTRSPAIIEATNLLLTIGDAWRASTREEQRDLVQMVLQQVGCNLETQRIAWVKPRPGLEILFQFVETLITREEGRFDIRGTGEQKV